MSIKKVLAVTLTPYLPVFGAIFGVILFGVSTYFGNTTMFFLSLIIISVLPPVLEEIGNSLKKKYEATQNEVDIIAMILKIPEWSLGLEMLSSIAIMIASAVLKSYAIFYLGLWLLYLGSSLGMAKEINELKEDLRSPDLEKRRAAVEVVKSEEQIEIMAALSLFGIGVLLNAVFGPFTLVEEAIMVVLLFASFIPAYIVLDQTDKLMPPEPGKVASATS